MTFPSLLTPKHTAIALIEQLITGFHDGSIALPSAQSVLFPGFEAALQDELMRYKKFLGDGITKDLPELSEDVSEVEGVFLFISRSIEGFIDFLAEFRKQRQMASPLDLQWYSHGVVTQLNRWSFIGQRQSQFADQITVLATTLASAIGGQESSILEELNLQLQLTLSELLKNILQNAAQVRIEIPRQAEDKNGTLQILIRCIEAALGKAKESRVAEIDARMRVLQLALTEKQALKGIGLLFNRASDTNREPRKND